MPQPGEGVQQTKPAVRISTVRNRIPQGYELSSSAVGRCLLAKIGTDRYCSPPCCAVRSQQCGGDAFNGRWEDESPYYKNCLPSHMRYFHPRFGEELQTGIDRCGKLVPKSLTLGQNSPFPKAKRGVGNIATYLRPDMSIWGRSTFKVANQNQSSYESLRCLRLIDFDQ